MYGVFYLPKLMTEYDQSIFFIRPFCTYVLRFCYHIVSFLHTYHWYHARFVAIIQLSLIN